MHIKPKYYIDLLENGNYSWRKLHLWIIRETPRFSDGCGGTYRTSWCDESDAEKSLIRSIKSKSFKIMKKRRSKAKETRTRRVPPFKLIGK